MRIDEGLSVEVENSMSRIMLPSRGTPALFIPDLLTSEIVPCGNKLTIGTFAVYDQYRNEPVLRSF